MSTLWHSSPAEAQNLPQRPSLPDKDDVESTWQYLETGLNRIMLEPSCGIDTQTLVGLYTAVYNYCTAQKAVGMQDGAHHRGAHLLGSELYMHLIKWLREYLDDLKSRAGSYSGDALIRFYVEEFTHYTKAARYIHHVFRYLHRHWVKREIDEGKVFIKETYELHISQWRDDLAEVSKDVKDAFERLDRLLDAHDVHDDRTVTIFANSLDELRLDENGDGGGAASTVPASTNGEGDASGEPPLQRRPSNPAVALHRDDISELKDELRRALRFGPDAVSDPGRYKPMDKANTMVKLITSDNAIVEIDRQSAECSKVVKLILEEIGDEFVSDEIIPLPNVQESVLRMCLQWCEHHRFDLDDWDSQRERIGYNSTALAEWDEKFFMVDQEMLFEIIMASNYLEIKPLLDMGCMTVANMIKGKNPEEIRRTFNITNDFTPEEEEQIRRENEWAEDRW